MAMVLRSPTIVSTVIRELQGKAELPSLEHRDDRLEVVLVAAGDPDLVRLDRRLHLELAVLDGFDDLLGLLRRDPLLDLDRLADRSAGGVLDLPEIQRLDRHSALDEFPL